MQHPEAEALAVRLSATCLDLLDGVQPAAPPANLDCDTAAMIIVHLSILSARLARIAGSAMDVPPEVVLQSLQPATA